MKLVITNFHFGGHTEKATARLFGPQPKSNLDQHLYLDIDVQYTIFRNVSFKISVSDNQILVSLPNQNTQLVVEFIRTRPEITDQASWPEPDKYKRKIAEILANMVETAELESLDDDVPKFIRIGAKTITR